jgi:holo-[acyl-carrier protein] synthase
MTRPAVLMGVDIVEADRLARAIRRGGATLAGHLTTVAERELCPQGAAFSVKESFIKAVGGRPPGFTWHDFEARAGRPAAWTGPLLDEAAAELAVATGLVLTGAAAYAVQGACGQAVRVRLAPRAGRVAGAARWGMGDGLLVSLAIVFVDADSAETAEPANSSEGEL